MSSTLVKVCKVHDIPVNLGVGALVKGEQVALFHLPTGEIYALGNFDPFSEANVLSRGIVCSVGERPAVASPLYKQHFDLTSGECLEKPEVAVKAYSVRIDGGAFQLS